MPGARWGTRGVRGASAPEYAIGAAVLAVALLFGLQALEGAADQRYDDEQAVVGTPVTDLSGAGTTTTAATGTTVTLPPALTTTTTAPPATTTTTTGGPTTTAPTTTTLATTTTVVRTLTFTATYAQSGSGNKDWWINYSVTASPSTSATVTITWPGGSRTNCSLPCSGSTSPLFDKNLNYADISTTTVAGYTGPSQTTIRVFDQ